MPDHWLIAYLSGTGDLTPEAVAEEINPFAYRLLRERTSLPGMGMWKKSMDGITSLPLSEMVWA